MYSFGQASKFAIMFWTLFIASLPLLSYFLLPKLVFFIGSVLGYYLKQKTAGRRAQILELVEADEKEFLVENGNRRDSGEWENVDSYAAPTAKNGEKADKEWGGIVGFFHPFW